MTVRPDGRAEGASACYIYDGIKLVRDAACRAHIRTTSDHYALQLLLITDDKLHQVA